MNQEPSPRPTGPTPDTHDGFMLERPLNLPTSGCTRNDMRSAVSFQVLEELTGVDVRSLRSQTYDEERLFWRQYFESTQHMPQDMHSKTFMRERSLSTVEESANRRRDGLEDERVTAA